MVMVHDFLELIKKSKYNEGYDAILKYQEYSKQNDFK